MSANYDVVILGGGLAGLTLALQLRQQFAAIADPGARAPQSSGAGGRAQGRRVVGRDRRALLRHRARAERASQQQQLSKFGFRFFFTEGRSDIDQVAELGASRYLSTPSYQLDRGIFENFLGEHARSLGVQFVDGATVRSFDLGANGAAHRVRFAIEG